MGIKPSARGRLPTATQDPGELAITIVTVEETLTGWYGQIRKAKNDEQMIRAYTALQQAVEFCARVRILPMDEDAAERFHELRSSKRRTGTNDLKIASIALVRKSRDFKGIPNLRIESWG